MLVENIEPQTLEALLRLSLGALVFTFLTFLFYYLGRGLEAKESKESEENEWLGKEKLIVVDIIEETHDIKTFRFKRVNKKEFEKFIPGQFLSFQIGDNEKVARSYSISGSCENTSTLQVSIKLIKDGVGSSYFHALKIRDEVIAYPPSGHFTDVNNQDGPSIYIVGGIGITPALSMIKTAVDRAQKREMILFYGVRSTKDLAFHDGLSVLVKRYDHFKYYPILSEEDKSWRGDFGFINTDYINSKISIDKNAHFYFCGPPILTDTVTEQLIKSGIEKKQIHQEKFVSPTNIDVKELKVVKAQIEVDGQELEYSGTETLLDFLEKESIPIDSACRSGVCGACQCKLISGEVDQLTEAGLSDEDKNSDMILSCVSRPKTNLKLTVSS